MTVKSIVDIDVNDDKFKEFNELWQKYSSKLEDTPGVWAGVNKEMQSGFKTIAAALLAMQQTQRQQKKVIQEETGLWRDIAKSTKTVAVNIKDATFSLLKWAGITGIISGLIGGGGLFGLDLLAANVGSGRKSALGLGVTYGEQRSFDVNFGRLVDSDAFLSGVNEALHDVTKRAPLYGAGLGEGDLKGKDTAQVSIALLEKIKALADRTPDSLLGQLLQSRGLDRFMSLQDVERLKKTPSGEVGQYVKEFGRDAKAFGLTDRDQRLWQNFQVQMARAGQKIESVFVHGLTPLTPALSHFSDAVGNFVDHLMKAVEKHHWIDRLADGMDKFAKYIDSPKFLKDLDTFATDVALVAQGLADALKWLGVIPKSDAEKTDAKKAKEEEFKGSLAGKTLGWGSGAGKWLNDTMVGGADWMAKKLLAPGSKDWAGSKVPGLGYFNRSNKDTFESPEERTAKNVLNKFFPGSRVTGEGRSQKHNDELEGSAKNSMHVTGEAIDFVLPKGITFAMFKAFLKANHLPVTELFNEGAHGKQGAHVHWGWRPKGPERADKATKTVRVEINNNTGGNAIANASQLTVPA